FTFEADAEDGSNDTITWIERPTFAGGDESIDMSLPTPASNIAPAAGSVSATTPITWTNGSFATTTVEVCMSETIDTAGYDLFCVTEGARCSIDFSSLIAGFALPAGQPVTINVRQVFDLGIDAFMQTRSTAPVYEQPNNGRQLSAALAPI